MEVRGFLSTKGMYQPLFRQYMTYQSKAVLQHSDQKAQNNNTVQGGWTGLHVLKIFLLVNFLLVGILSLLWNGVILDFLYLAYHLFFFFLFSELGFFPIFSAIVSSQMNPPGQFLCFLFVQPQPASFPQPLHFL